jgi:hypothetical protein
MNYYLCTNRECPIHSIVRTKLISECPHCGNPLADYEKVHATFRWSDIQHKFNQFEAYSAFTAVMWKKLQENVSKGGWSSELPQRLMERLHDEVRELELTLAQYLADPTIDRTAKTEALAIQVSREAADVANFAMMVADVVGGLRRNDPSRG